MGTERLDRLARMYSAQVNGRIVPWSQWEQERTAARRFLRDKPVALAEFNAVVKQWRMDERRPLPYERWLDFLLATRAALKPHCDLDALADAIAASR